MPSISSRQKKLLDTNFLDLTGKSSLEYGAISLDSLTDTLASFALQFAETARNKLNASDRVASGALSDSIIPTRVEILGKMYNVNINVASYYDFVNQGVKGWADEKGGNSPYQFKQYSGKSGKKDSPMIKAIKQWIIKEGLKGTGKENAHPRATRRDNKRASITDSSLSTAIAISRSVKKKGLKPSRFWTDTRTEMTKKIETELSKALKIDIISNIIPN